LIYYFLTYFPRTPGAGICGFSNGESKIHHRLHAMHGLYSPRALCTRTVRSQTSAMFRMACEDKDDLQIELRVKRRHPDAQLASQIRSSIGTPKPRPNSSAISNEIPHLYIGGPSRRSGGDTRNRRCAAASSVTLSMPNQRELARHRL
jgi:hypothetical protein